MNKNICQIFIVLVLKEKKTMIYGAWIIETSGLLTRYELPNHHVMISLSCNIDMYVCMYVCMDGWMDGCINVFIGF